MKKKEQVLHFYRLYLHKEETTEIKLSEIIINYLNTQKNISYSLKDENKSIVLVEYESDNNEIILKYEIMKYGEKKNVKNVETRINAGINIEKNQYIEEFQYILISKISDVAYNIVLQGKQTGISKKHFFNLLYDFYTDYKKNSNDNISETNLEIKEFFPKNFTEKIKEFNANYIKITSDETENEIMEDPDISFSRKTKYSSKINFIIKEKKAIFDRKIDLEKFIKKINKKYPKAHIEIKGCNENFSKDSIFSTNISYNRRIKVELIEVTGKLNSRSLIEEMKKENELLRENSFIIM